MPELMIAVVDETGLDGQDISKYLEGQIALERFEHAGTCPLFMIFHWHLNSTGADHSVSIMDNYFRMRDFSVKNLNRKNRGVDKILILIPPDLASARGWLVEEFIEAVVENNVEGHPTYIIYKTLMHSIKCLLSDAVEATSPDQRVIFKNLASPSRNRRFIPEP